MTAGQVNPQALWTSFVSQARTAGKSGDMAGVIALFRERIEKTALPPEDRRQIGAIFHEISMVVRQQGDRAASVSGFEEAARYFREAGDKALLQQALGSQADALIDGGDFQRAIPVVAERTRICREVGDQAALFNCLTVQGKLLHWAGDSDNASLLAEQQEELARELNSSDALATSLSNRGLLLIAEGKLEEAAALFEEAERMLRNGGRTRQLANVIGGRAVVAMQQGDNTGALSLQREAESVCRELGDDEGLAKSLVMQGLILGQLGRAGEGWPLAQEADRLARSRGWTSMAEQMIAPVLATLRASGGGAGEVTPLALFETASTHLHAGRLDEAIKLLGQARDLAQSSGDSKQAATLSAYLEKVQQVAAIQAAAAPARAHLPQSSRSAPGAFEAELAAWSRLSWFKRLTTPRPRPPR